MTILPHDAGWPPGAMLVRIKIPDLPQINQERWYWITNVPGLQNIQPQIPLARKNPPEYARINLTPKEATGAVPEIPTGKRICFCGRIPKPAHVGEVQGDVLYLVVRRDNPRRTIVANANVTTLVDGDECWFEAFDAGTRDGLLPGTYFGTLTLRNQDVIPPFRLNVVEVED